MPNMLFEDKESNHINEWVQSNLKEIKEDYGGKFIAVLETEEILVKEQYVELLHELEKREVNLESVTITNIPTEKK